MNFGGFFETVILDSGASAGVAPVSLVNRMHAADDPALRDIGELTVPIRFNGVFGNSMCTHVAIFKVALPGKPDHEVTFMARLFNTASVLIPAPYLDRWKWDFMGQAFAAFGDSGGPRVAVSYVSRTPIDYGELGNFRARFTQTPSGPGKRAPHLP
jgi:hypothetical protein